MTLPGQLQLIGESFSPWTKKARWALEYCGLAFDYKEYTPTLSEPALRLRLKQWRGPVSVPLAFAGDETIHGSWAIACHANTQSGDSRLGDMNAIRTWDGLSEAALAEGRSALLRRILSCNPALEESLPSFVTNAVRRPLRFLARDAVQRLERKYAHLVVPGSLREALLQTRQHLANNGCEFLLNKFSYADITMIAVLEMIAPLAVAEPPLGPAVARCWHDEVLANEFNDLLAWRRRLVAASKTSYSQYQSEWMP